jgi:hypothetical protein
VGTKLGTVPALNFHALHFLVSLSRTPEPTSACSGLLTNRLKRDVGALWVVNELRLVLEVLVGGSSARAVDALLFQFLI